MGMVMTGTRLGAKELGERKAEGETQEVRGSAVRTGMLPQSSHQKGIKDLLGVVISDPQPVAGSLQGSMGLC